MINNNQHRNTNNGNTAKNIKNSTTKLTNRNSTKGNIEELSPWLVQDNVINNKKSEKSKIPMLKTVITTEL